ncbi:uncharacterized protein EDB91DRAFT_750013 [Suillus paluster]|uniref:uncharacterized protein n=1 Tax=Suillus paluster TaxID=48578 RepID=UPI001B881920|nr:uncharacterized protein EDB91DRAFT_750013 [Suillus paluster]KAG1730696.1 hypothetical protein EDB91DRAFT_750013 [Suillus paluster]
MTVLPITQSVTIMQELEDVTGIKVRNLIAFRGHDRRARETLMGIESYHYVAGRYFVLVIFGVHSPEKKQNALGRFLQEIVAQSGDITALD